MTPPSQTPRVQSPLACYFWLGETLRSRSVSRVVRTGTVDVPVLPPRLIADCEREISDSLGLAPGDVEALSLARARRRWPDFQLWVRAVSDWMRSQRLPDLLADCDIALMACRGVRYHHDAEQYGGMAFCNLFLSEDKGLDLCFPHSGHRIPLTRGTVVIFDTGQPHGVIRRGATAFNTSDFAPERDCTLLFLTWELPIENAQVKRAIGVDFDIDPVTALRLDEAQIWLNGARASVCPETGFTHSVDSL
jgi:hypothetical protein